MRAFLVMALLGLVFACSGDDGSDGGDNPDASNGPLPDADPDAPDAVPLPDAEPLPACAEDLGTQDDGSSANETNPNIVISEVDPGEFIELYNAGSGTVMLSATGYRWCNNRNYSTGFTAHNFTIPAGGRRVIEWPGGNGSETNGDVSIYANGSFTIGSSILDYVCWGNAGSPNRNSEANLVGKWSGNCADSIPAGGSLVRRANREGIQASDYETQNTPDPEDCD
jgi:hypothetical protein